MSVSVGLGGVNRFFCSFEVARAFVTWAEVMKRETVPLLTSDMTKKTVSVLAN